MTIRAIDLFCGGGGSSAGAVMAGATMVGAVDAWDIATATYADNFASAKRNVITERLTDATGPEIFSRIGRVDLLLASPECTHHSVARGARPRDEESRRSGWYVMNMIRELSPRWLVLENVTPMRNWPGFDDLIHELRHRYGYNLEILPLDSAEFGVPQNRRRLFIIADRLAVPRPPVKAKGQQKPARKILASKDEFGWTPLYAPGRAPKTLERAERAIKELGKGVDFLLVYYGSDQAGGWQTLDRPLRTLTTLDRFGLVSWIDGIPMMRMLQVPELKKAMGLPKWFRLEHGTRRDKIRLLGNGVCAPVMEAVVRSLVESPANLRVGQSRPRTERSICASGLP